MHATKAAVEEGVVAGGGVDCFSRVRFLAGSTRRTTTRRSASTSSVRRSIAGAADRGEFRRRGLDRRRRLTDKTMPNFGYDAQLGDYKDMVAAGNHRSDQGRARGMQDAASVAGLLITTEAMVADRPEPKGAPGMPPGGMGGKGGMDLLKLRSSAPDEVLVVADGCDDHKLARDIIDVHGREAATVAPRERPRRSGPGQAVQARSWIRVSDHSAATDWQTSALATNPKL